MKLILFLFATLVCGFHVIAQENRAYDLADNNETFHDSDDAVHNIDPINIRQLVAYPNPFNESLTISTFESGNIEIVTMEGLIVKKFKLNMPSDQIDVRDLKEGFYLVKFRTEKSVYTIRVVKTT